MECLNLGQIERLVLGTMDAGQEAAYRRHLEHCPTCRARLEECRANQEMLHVLREMEDDRSGRAAPVPATDSFPGYDIVREIHRGGQGVVYQAVQKATKRKVAIKVMREGPFASRREKARFEREVEILGQLNHPNIVGIHDSGVASGSFYFVMDYVSGQPLDVWMAAREHSIDETLRLFARICEAVNAAHLRGIIHRDLKPGNIRIGTNGEPHILDFGLAKMAAGSDASVMTMTGQFMGSLPWASPEQAEGVPEKIDTRTDVYSLGVILYQMLTGRFPYEVIGNMRDVLDRIMKAEPARPSTIRRQINDEVETIVLKCLSKERERRYQTAGELARDISHYLTGEPIEAKRDSFGYMLQKQLRRYKLHVAVTGGFILMLVVSLAAALTLWQRAVADRDRALRAEAKATTERHNAVVARDQAEQERRRAERERTRADERELQARQNLYPWQLTQVQRAWERGELSTARRLLDEQYPNPGEEDLRGFEWRYFRRLCMSGSERGDSMETATGRSRILQKTETMVTCVAYSPDGRMLAASNVNGLVTLWDTTSWQEIGTLTGFSTGVYHVAFSPDGKTLATASVDQTVKLWDVAQRRVLRALASSQPASSPVTSQPAETPLAHSGVVFKARFSPDGKLLATASADCTAGLWDVVSGRQKSVLRGHGRDVHDVCFAPDGKLLATAGFDGTIRFWDPADGAQVPMTLVQDKEVWAIAFSPDGKALVSAAAGGILKTWDVETGRERMTLAHGSGDLLDVAFSPDGRLVATAGRDRLVRIWDVAQGRLRDSLRGHGVLARTVAFSPDGNTLVSGGSWILIWDPNQSDYFTTVTKHARASYTVAFSPDGDTLASSGLDGRMKLFDVKHNLEAGELAADRSLWCAVFSPDGKYLAAGDYTGQVHLYSTSSRSLIGTTKEHRGGIQDLAFSPDSRLLATAGADGLSKIWDVQGSTGQSVATLRAVANGPARAVAFSPDGKLLATAGADMNVSLWNAGAWTGLTTLKGHTSWVEDVDFSPDGTLLASTGGDATVRIWRLAAGNECNVLYGNTRMGSVDFAPDGRTLATALDDGSIQLWNHEVSFPLLTLGGHALAARHVAFSPDGALLASCAEDGSVFLWPALDAKPLEGSIEYAEVLAQRAAGLLRDQDYTKAAALLADALRIASIAPEGTAEIRSRFRVDYARCILRMGEDRQAEAERHLLAAYSELRSNPGPSAPITREAARELASLSRMMGKELEAVDYEIQSSWPDVEVASFRELIMFLVACKDRRDPARIAGEIIRLTQTDFDLISPKVLAEALDRYLAADAPAVIAAWLSEVDGLARLRLAYGVLVAQRPAIECLFPALPRIAEELQQHKERVRELRYQWLYVGRTLLLAGDTERGRTVLRAVVAQAAPEEQWWNVFVGWGDLLAGDIDSARNSLNLTVERTKERADASSRIGLHVAQYLLGTEPENDFRNLARGGRDLTYFFLGETALLEGRIDAARTAYRTSVSLNGGWSGLSRVRLAQLDGKLPGAPAPLPLEKRLRGDSRSAAELNSLSWEIVRSSARTREEYQRAVELARRACALAPGDRAIINTLGVALYRAGDYRGALVALQESARKASETDPFDGVFMAMAHHRLGNKEAAEASFAELLTIMADRKWQDDVDAAVFFQEAKTLFEHAAQPQRTPATRSASPGRS